MNGAERAAVTGAAVALAVGHIAPHALARPGIRRRFPLIAGVGHPGHVALTFDDGPDPATTSRIVEALTDLHARATFFCLGEMVEQAGDLPAEMAAAGHELAVHGYDHSARVRRDPRIWGEHLRRTRGLIEDRTGQPVRWYRPPHGKLNGAMLLAARRLSLQPVLWTAEGQDWTDFCTPSSILETLRPDLRGGATVVLHDTDRQAAPGSWRATLGALPPLFDELAARDLSVGPLGDHGLSTMWE